MSPVIEIQPVPPRSTQSGFAAGEELGAMYVVPESRAPFGSTAKPAAKNDAGASAFLSCAPVSRPALGSLGLSAVADEDEVPLAEEQAVRASGSTAAASSALAAREG